MPAALSHHIVIAQTGDTLKVTNPDAVGHNANLGFFNNKQQNFTIPAGQEKTVALEESEPAPIPVDCNIHPWMKSYVDCIGPSLRRCQR